MQCNELVNDVELVETHEAVCELFSCCVGRVCLGFSSPHPHPWRASGADGHRVGQRGLGSPYGSS